MGVVGTKFNNYTLRCYRKGYAYSIRHNLRVFRPPPFPHYIQLELTNNCNMRCSHCSRQRFMDKRLVGYMDFELFKKIIDEMRSFPQCFLRIGGLGEQALHPEFEKMMDYLKEHSVRFEVVTNGLLLLKFTPLQIMDSGIEILGISIDGNDPVSYSRYRFGGNYEMIREKVIQFYTEKRRNHREMPELQIRNVIFPHTTPNQIRMFKQNWIPFSDFIRFNTLTSGLEKEAESLKRCSEIDFTIHIRWNGLVPLCGHIHWYSDLEWVGDVGKTSIKSIWKNSRLDQLRDAHHRMDFDSFSFCKRCSKSQYSEKSLKNIVKWNEHRNPLISRLRSLVKWLSGHT